MKRLEWMVRVGILVTALSPAHATHEEKRPPAVSAGEHALTRQAGTQAAALDGQGVLASGVRFRPTPGLCIAARLGNTNGFDRNVPPRQESRLYAGANAAIDF
ncbi:MAG: hypothetical protein JXO72_14390 [Vicinamibacteria bacterium]|nr:hypothetical protein [Vicinamibacteria bacterium]